MKVLHLARKPISEGSVAANVLKHGTGALNIDDCRISPGERVPGGGNGKAHKGRRYGTYETCGERPLVKPHTRGRWPANLILEHLPGCRCVGVKKVKGITGGTTSGDNAFGQDVGWNPHENRPMDIARQMDPNGKETVEAWKCAPGCPVATLDDQSGPTGASAPVEGSEPSVASTGNVTGQRARVPGVFHGDSGGASRFFKQIKKLSP